MCFKRELCQMSQRMTTWLMMTSQLHSHSWPVPHQDQLRWYTQWLSPRLLCINLRKQPQQQPPPQHQQQHRQLQHQQPQLSNHSIINCQARNRSFKMSQHFLEITSRKDPFCIQRGDQVAKLQWASHLNICQDYLSSSVTGCGQGELRELKTDKDLQTTDIL